MNTKELVNIIELLEIKENKTSQYMALDKLGVYYEEDTELYDRKTGKPYNTTFVPHNIYTLDEINLINNWAEKLGEDNFDYTPFAERTFLRNFLTSIPLEEQIKYIKHTNMYYGPNKDKADKNYVLVMRRSLPTIEDKPEAFWSNDPTTPLWGLKYEISKDQRGYSAILVTTLGKLEEHGKQDFDLLSGGASDGEIITSGKPFPRNKILFAFKPIDEISLLLETIKNSDRPYNDFVNEIKSKMENRYYSKPIYQAENNSQSDDFEFGDWD